MVSPTASRTRPTVHHLTGFSARAAKRRSTLPVRSEGLGFFRNSDDAFNTWLDGLAPAPTLGLGEASMQLAGNGETHDVQEGLTIRGLIEHLGLTDGPVAVERNRDVVPRAEHASTGLQSGDVLEIVHFVGGG